MTPAPVTAGQLTIVPANEASWADLQAIFGVTDYPGRCSCQRYKSENGARALEAELVAFRTAGQDGVRTPSRGMAARSPQLIFNEHVS